MMDLLKSIRHKGGHPSDDIALRTQIEPYYRFLEKTKQELDLLQ